MGILAVIIAFGILVIFHEFGHYIFALITGMEVKKFSIGFGPPVLRKRLGKTDFLLSLIPLGGYVKIKGDEFEEKGFYDFPLWKKVVVVLGGPLFSLLLAFIIMVGVYSFYGEEIKEPVIFLEDSTYYFNQGLRTGDRIIKIDGDTVKDFSNLLRFFPKYNKKNVTLIIERNGKITNLNVKINVDSLSKIGYLLPPVIGDVINKDAIKKGLSKGDIIKSIDGDTVQSWYDIYRSLHYERSKTWEDIKNIIFEKREGDSVLVVWQKKEGEIKKDYIKLIKLDNGRVGLGIIAKVNKNKLGPIKGFIKALKWTYTNTILIVEFLFQLVTGKVSLKNIGGPVMIASVSFQAVKAGLKPYLILIAFLSLNLMVINLLPLPALDGGRAFMFVIEGIIRRKFNKKIWTYSVSISFLLLILLLIVVTFKDIISIIK